MCGIVGVMDFGGTAITGAGMSIFMQMLHADAVRGMHGTGVFAVDKEGSNYRLRVGGPPHKLVDSSEWTKFEEFVQKKYVRFMVGHNRYATRGGISTETSHPFRDGEIMLVHNGTLESYSHLPDAKDYNVDSEAICHSISKWGAEKTIPTLRGAWALVWYDGFAKTLNFIRNKERPLCIARHKKHDMIAFASEMSMLQWVLERNGEFDMDYATLPENQLVTYQLGSIKPHVKELKGKSAFYDEKGWAAWGKGAREDQLGTSSSLVEKDSKVIEIPFKKHSNMTSSSTSNKTSSNKGLLPAPQKSAAKKGSTDTPVYHKGYWVSAEAIHDVVKKTLIVVTPIDYKPIDTDRARAEGLFQIKALSDNFPDIEFFCNVKGYKSVEAIMEAPEGMRASVKSILRSMSHVAQFPHQIYLDNPEPMYNPEPETVPEHSVVKP